MHSGPFGQYAAIIAGIVGIGVLAAWLATRIGLAPADPLLDSAALLIIGVIFGTGAGARVIANGAERKADVANTRLDSIHAPAAASAERIVSEETAA